MAARPAPAARRAASHESVPANRVGIDLAAPVATERLQLVEVPRRMDSFQIDPLGQRGAH